MATLVLAWSQGVHSEQLSCPLQEVWALLSGCLGAQHPWSPWQGSKVHVLRKPMRLQCYISHSSPQGARSLQLLPSPLPKNPGSLCDNNNKNKNNKYLFFTLSVSAHMGVSVQEYVNVREVVCKSKGGHRIPWSWSHRQLWVVHMSCQEPNSSPLKEQWVFFATEPSCHLSKLGSLLRPGARPTSLQKSLIDALGTHSTPFCVQRRVGTESISMHPVLNRSDL